MDGFSLRLDSMNTSRQLNVEDNIQRQKREMSLFCVIFKE